MCPFCSIVRGDDPGAREVYRDDRVVAFLPHRPATLGHTLLIPREHVADIWSLDESTASTLARATLALSGAVREATGASGLNVIQSNGADASQTVFHLHVHIVPRSAGDSFGNIWKSGIEYPESDVEAAWKQIRQVSEKLTVTYQVG